MNNRRKTGQTRIIKREHAFDVEDEDGIQTLKSADANEGRQRCLLSDSLSTDDDPVLRQSMSETVDAARQHLLSSIGSAIESTKAPPSAAAGERGRSLRRLRDRHDSSVSSFSDRSLSFDERGSVSSFGDVASQGRGSLCWQNPSHSEKHCEGKSSEGSNCGRTKPPYCPIGGHLAGSDGTGPTARDNCRPPVSVKPFRSLNQEEPGQNACRSSAALLHRPYRSCDISLGRSGSHLKASAEPATTDTALPPSKHTCNVKTMRKIFEEGPPLPSPSPAAKSNPFPPQRTAAFKEAQSSAIKEDIRTTSIFNQTKQSFSGKLESVTVPAQPPPVRHRSWDALIPHRTDVSSATAAAAPERARPVKSRSLTTDIASIVATPDTASAQQVSSVHPVSLQTPFQEPRRRLPFPQQPKIASSKAIEQHTPSAADESAKPPGRLGQQTTESVRRSATLPKSMSKVIAFSAPTSKTALRTKTSRSEEDLTKYRSLVSHRLPSPARPTFQTPITPLSPKKPSPHLSAPASNSRVFNASNLFNTLTPTERFPHSQCDRKESESSLDKQILKPDLAQKQKALFSTSSYLPSRLSGTSSLPYVKSSSCANTSSSATKTSTLKLGALAVASSVSNSDTVNRTSTMPVPSEMPLPGPVSKPSASNVMHASAADSGTESSALSVSSLTSRPALISPHAAVQHTSVAKPAAQTVLSSELSMTSPSCAVSSSVFARTQGGVTSKAAMETSAPCVECVFRSKTVLTLLSAKPKEAEVKRVAAAEGSDAIGLNRGDEGGVSSHTGCTSVEPLALSANIAAITPPTAIDSEKKHKQNTAISLQSTAQATSPFSQESFPPPITSLEKLDSQSKNQAPEASRKDSNDGKQQCVGAGQVTQSQTPNNFEKGMDRLTKAAAKYIPNAPLLQSSGFKTRCLHPRDAQPNAELTAVSGGQTAIHVSTSTIDRNESSKDPDGPVLVATSNMLPDNDIKDQKSIAKDDIKLYKGDIKLNRDDIKLCKDDMKLCKGDIKLCKDDIKLCKDDIKLCKDDIELCKDDTSDFTDSAASSKLLPLPKHSAIMRNRWRQQNRNRRNCSSSSISISSSSSDEDASIAMECRTRKKKRPSLKSKSATNSASEASRP